MTEPAKPVYLDYNASTPLLPEVLAAMMPFLTEHHGNPSSPHVFGRIMSEAVETARGQVASLIECDPDEIYFTSGGTESNNLAIRGVPAANTSRRQIITSMIEHPAALNPCAYLEEQGYRIDRIPVDKTGTVMLDAIRSAIGKETILVSMMHANSETGTVQPIREIARIAHSAGALMHTDAAQTIGKIPVSVQREEVDLLSVAGHKLYAPQGVGALYVRHGTDIAPLLHGASHERGLRPGTENVASIAGLGTACSIARRDLSEVSRRTGQLRDLLWNRLKEQVPGLAVNGHRVNCLPNTLSARFPGVSGNALLAACPAVAASTGSACHETGSQASAVILAMGVAENEAAGTVRLTLGRNNSRAEIEWAADELANAWERLTRYA